MAEQYIAVGDIHGCLAQLDELLAFAADYPNHRLVFLGDYIDRGPDPEGVISRLKSLNAVFLRGNHEEMFLTRFEQCRDTASLAELYAKAAISKSSKNWIAEKTLFSFETPDYLFVHAGLDKQKPLSQQTARDFMWSTDDGDYYTVTPKTVVHGHLIVEAPVQIGNRLNINTGSGSGGYLSAVVLPEMHFFRSTQTKGVVFNWAQIRQELDEFLEELESTEGLPANNAMDLGT